MPDQGATIKVVKEREKYLGRKVNSGKGSITLLQKSGENMLGSYGGHRARVGNDVESRRKFSYAFYCHIIML